MGDRATPPTSPPPLVVRAGTTAVRTSTRRSTCFQSRWRPARRRLYSPAGAAYAGAGTGAGGCGGGASAPGTAGGCRRVRYEPIHQAQREVFGRARGLGPGTPLAAGSHRSWSSSFFRSLLRARCASRASWARAASAPIAARAVLRWSSMRVLPEWCRRNRGVRRLMGDDCGGGSGRPGVRGRTTQVSSGPGALCPGQAGQHSSPGVGFA